MYILEHYTKTHDDTFIAKSDNVFDLKTLVTDPGIIWEEQQPGLFIGNIPERDDYYQIIDELYY